MRINLGAVLGLAAFGALSYATLAFPAPQWQSVLQNTLGGLLLVMLVAGVAGRGKARSYALGFTVASLGYLAICYAPIIQVRDKLVTQHILEMARDHLVRDASELAMRESLAIPIVKASRVERGLGDSTATASAATQSAEFKSAANGFESQTYFVSGHLLWCLMLGFTGGLMAAAMVDETRIDEHQAD